MALRLRLWRNKKPIFSSFLVILSHDGEIKFKEAAFCGGEGRFEAVAHYQPEVAFVLSGASGEFATFGLLIIAS